MSLRGENRADPQPLRICLNGREKGVGCHSVHREALKEAGGHQSPLGRGPSKCRAILSHLSSPQGSPDWLGCFTGLSRSHHLRPKPSAQSPVGPDSLHFQGLVVLPKGQFPRAALGEELVTSSLLTSSKGDIALSL